MGELGQRAVRGFIRAIGRMKRDQVITRCGIEMPYLFAGSGQPLLMIHGFADRKETWSLTAPFLALRHQVLCPDLPGYGMAGPIEPSQASLTSQASFLLDFMDALGLESAHLCGNSMGGGVALALAADAQRAPSADRRRPKPSAPKRLAGVRGDDGLDLRSEAATAKAAAQTHGIGTHRQAPGLRATI